jgi:ElaB/YqjD/DUF883 family membrane-anchored ribosome-binding protein
MAQPSPTISVDALSERASDLSQPVEMAKEIAGEAVQDVKDAVDQVRYQSELLSQSPGLAGDVARFTRKRPFEALLIATAFAFTIGAIWKR